MGDGEAGVGAVERYLNVVVQRRGDTTVLELDGELDLGSAPYLEAEIERALRGGAESVVVDVRRLRFMDMAGLRVLLVGQERAEGAGRRLVLTGVREPIRRVLALARVGHLLAVE